MAPSLHHSLVRGVPLLSGSPTSSVCSTSASKLTFPVPESVQRRGGGIIISNFPSALKLRRTFGPQQTLNDRNLNGVAQISQYFDGAVEPMLVRRRQFIASSAGAALVALSAASPDASSAQDVVPSPQKSGSESGEGRTVFVAGATGNTGKRIVSELLRKGFRVRAGCRDIAKAKLALPSGDDIDFVLADVTQGAEKLAQAIRGVDAVVVATGFRPSITDPLASWNVDNLGTVALVDAASIAGVKRFVLVSSILVNGAAVGQFLNPAYVILNLFGLTLVAKLQAEKYIRQSGIEYTIIRPGGLKNDAPSGNLVLAREDTLFAGSVSRDSVAQVAVDSLLYPEASFKVVELIAEPNAPAVSVQQLLAAIPA